MRLFRLNLFPPICFPRKTLPLLQFERFNNANKEAKYIEIYIILLYEEKKKDLRKRCKLTGL